MTRPAFILGSVMHCGYSSSLHSPVPLRSIKQLLKEALMLQASFELDANVRGGPGRESADSSPDTSMRHFLCGAQRGEKKLGISI